MPAPQLHLTFGDLVQHNEGLPPALRRACSAEPVYTRLGSIFHDLPYYYAPMVFEALRYGLGAPALNEPWGYRVHSVRPDKLVASYLRAAKQADDLTLDERLALCAGLLSHCAIDLAMHPLVNYCARRDTRQHGGHESTHHRLTEKYHALFLHIDRYGEDVLGTAAFAERTRITKRGTSLTTGVEPALLRFMTDTYRGAYGGAPSTKRWSRWVRNFKQFGLLVSVPAAARNSRRSSTDAMRRRYYENEVFRCSDFFAAAERRMAYLGTLGYAYFMAGDFSPAAEEAFCAASGIDDLAEPRPVDIPALPQLDPVRGKVRKRPEPNAQSAQSARNGKNAPDAQHIKTARNARDIATVDLPDGAVAAAGLASLSGAEAPAHDRRRPAFLRFKVPFLRMPRRRAKKALDDAQKDGVSPGSSGQSVVR